jgi:DNA-binding NarL/FixJ family response regulator
VATRLVIADDHAIVRQGVRALLRAAEDLVVVGEAGRVDEIAPLLAGEGCDVLLLDLQLDRSSLPSVPAFAARARIVVLTMSEAPDDGLAAVQAGASAVVFKRSALDTLLDAIRAVAAGHVWLPPALQAAALGRPPRVEFHGLSAREQEVVRHVALGLRNAEIAARLGISDETVKKHLNAAFQKLGVRDRVRLTLWAIGVGLAETPARPA